MNTLLWILLILFVLYVLFHIVVSLIPWIIGPPGG